MNIFKKLALTLAVLGLVGTASAAPINGVIHFTGPATIAPGTAGTATSISFPGAVDIEETISTGHYSGILSTTSATFTGFTFGVVGTTGPLAVTPLWTFTQGGTYSFNLSSISINAFVGGTRVLEGFGTATSNVAGLDPTPGTWQMSFSGATASVSFQSNTVVPDSGSTLALLGLAMVGIEGLRRRMKAVKA